VSLVVAFVAGRWSAERVGAAPQTIDVPVSRTATLVPAAGDDRLETVDVDVPDAVSRAQALIRDGRVREALALIEAHLVESANDAEALFLLSDLRQMTGDVDAALDPLLDILRFPPTPEDGDRARQRLQLLINAREQQLIHAGDLAALVAYFERLVQAEPAWDGHRLKLARWLARSGQLDEASRLLREVGTTGVTEEEIEALATEIELASTALPLEREGGALYARASVSGPRRSASYRLLVDTGATMTGLSEQRLVAMGAERIRERASVHTAGGVVELPVYRITRLALGPLVVQDLPVLGFEELPGDADGLLGTDVLQRLSGGLPGAVGRPRDPR